MTTVARAGLRAPRTATVLAGTVGATWIGFAGVLARRDGVADALPVGCPFKALTGLDCPGCGSTRSLGAITRLDVLAAFDHNALVPGALVFVTLSFVVWTRSAWRRGPAREVFDGDGRSAATDLVRRPSVTISIAVVVIVFALTRNLDVGEWLASDRHIG